MCTEALECVQSESDALVAINASQQQATADAQDGSDISPDIVRPGRGLCVHLSAATLRLATRALHLTLLRLLWQPTRCKVLSPS